MRKLPYLFLTSLLLLAGCAGGFDPAATREGAEADRTLGQAFADNLIEVKPEHRALRICLLAAGAAELMVDSIPFGVSDVPAMRGRIDAMSAAVASAKSGSELWLEADMANVAFVFAKAFEQAGREKLGRILLGSLSVSNYLETAKRGAVAAYKASAMLRDSRRMFEGLEVGTYEVGEIWAACEGRIRVNRDIMDGMNRVRPPP